MVKNFSYRWCWLYRFSYNRITYQKKKVYIVDNLSTGFKKLLNKEAIFKTNIHNSNKINQILKENNIETIVYFSALIEESEKVKNMSKIMLKVQKKYF